MAIEGLRNIYGVPALKREQEPLMKKRKRKGGKRREKEEKKRHGRVDIRI